MCCPRWDLNSWTFAQVEIKGKFSNCKGWISEIKWKIRECNWKSWMLRTLLSFTMQAAGLSCYSRRSQWKQEMSRGMQVKTKGRQEKSAGCCSFSEINWNFTEIARHSVVNWKNVISAITKLRSFHVRLTRGLLYGNKHLNKFGYKEDRNCQLCTTPLQTFQHLMIECPIILHLSHSLE